MLVTEFGIVTSSNCEQPEKAQVSMDVTPSGITIDLISVYENVSLFIVFNLPLHGFVCKN